MALAAPDLAALAVPAAAPAPLVLHAGPAPAMAPTARPALAPTPLMPAAAVSAALGPLSASLAGAALPTASAAALVPVPAAAAAVAAGDPPAVGAAPRIRSGDSLLHGIHGAVAVSDQPLSPTSSRNAIAAGVQAPAAQPLPAAPAPASAAAPLAAPLPGSLGSTAAQRARGPQATCQLASVPELLAVMPGLSGAPWAALGAMPVAGGAYGQLTAGMAGLAASHTGSFTSGGSSLSGLSGGSSAAAGSMAAVAAQQQQQQHGVTAAARAAQQPLQPGTVAAAQWWPGALSWHAQDFTSALPAGQLGGYGPWTTLPTSLLPQRWACSVSHTTTLAPCPLRPCSPASFWPKSERHRRAASPFFSARSGRCGRPADFGAEGGAADGGSRGGREGHGSAGPCLRGGGGGTAAGAAAHSGCQHSHAAGQPCAQRWLNRHPALLCGT